MKTTFKVHSVTPVDVVNGAPRAEKLNLHPIDPHEAGDHDLVNESRSGEGRLQLKIDVPEMLGAFKVGDYVRMTIEVLPKI